MKVLAISDIVIDRLYTPQLGEYFRGVELVLSCGDLPYDYLEFLVSCLNIPLLFVPGNHDPQYDEKNSLARADGCENIDGRVVQVKGLTIAGLGGSIRYQPERVNQYTQNEMFLRVLAILPTLIWKNLYTRHQPDIIIAHSPPHGIHDDDDPAHRGFTAFGRLIRIVRPRYFLHGHTMVYKSNLVSGITQYNGTSIINVYPYRLIEVDANVQ